MPEALGNVESLSYFIPELVLSFTVLVVLMADVFGIEREDFDTAGIVALLGSGIAFGAHIFLYWVEPVPLFMGMIAHDYFGLFFRGFFILCTIIVIYMTMFSREIVYSQKGEYHAILLSIAVGMCLVATSRNLVMIYLAVELMSLGSYLLAGFSRTIGKSEEASLKFILYGGVSTGVMLFGMTFLYGLTNSTDFGEIQAALANTELGIDLVAYVVFLFILVGAGYKIAMVPFHFWAPDVYEGSPTPITAYLSVASKATGFALLIRLFYSTLLQPMGESLFQEVGNIGIDWTTHIAILAVLTMTIGNLGAIVQNNLKRFMAYSGVAHAGYILMGASALSVDGIESIIFYMIMYLFTNFVAFLVIILVIESQDDDRIATMRGLGLRAPIPAAMMTLALFSLTGLPPTAGFAGKYYLFYAALDAKLYWLVIAAALNTVISLFYYARIIKAMYLEEAFVPEPIKVRLVFAVPIVVLAIPVLYFGIFWNPLAYYAQLCASMIL
jgi:NADH-quinone oxidoreductase subunit N